MFMRVQQSRKCIHFECVDGLCVAYTQYKLLQKGGVIMAELNPSTLSVLSVIKASHLIVFPLTNSSLMYILLIHRRQGNRKNKHLECHINRPNR